jgi:hypothetical protein
MSTLLSGRVEHGFEYARTVPPVRALELVKIAATYHSPKRLRQPVATFQRVEPNAFSNSCLIC